MIFLELYIDSMIMWITFYFIGKILFEETKKVSIIKLALCILSFSFALGYLNYINSEILHGIIKILCVYSLFCLYYKIIFNRSWSKVFTASLILYLCLCVSEVIIVLLTSIVTGILNKSMLFIKNNIVMNALIAISDYSIVKILESKLVSAVRNTNISKRDYLIVILIILITLSLLLFKIPFNQWELNFEFAVTMIILLCFCLIGLFLLKQKSDIEKTTSMYQQVVEYSDITNNLLEDYRVVSHEHKNQLSIIRGMLNEDNKELVDYVDDLLEKRNIIKYQWISELNHLPLSGLKGLINYKLMEMENEKINLSITISKDLMKTKLNKLNSKQKDNLYSIVGVYLDNAIQASKESKKREISLEIFKEKKQITFILANTYKGEIQIDKIDNYGYTTKGKNHGVGLHIVKKIMDENPMFSQKRMLFQDYYVQELRIDLSNIK